ncbi:amidohydrolase family protein [Hyphomonas beringensis]|nr:amidohydrolase family protein [Hyphomonas beringensis]
MPKLLRRSPLNLVGTSIRTIGLLSLLLTSAAGNAAYAEDASETPHMTAPWAEDPYPSTYKPETAAPLAIINATILTAAGPAIADGTLLIENNKIRAVGTKIEIPDGWQVIDASGQWVTPGIIDAHSHAGTAYVPGVEDGLNEMTGPNTVEMFAEFSLWPQSPVYPRLRNAGVTTIQVLPGSANIFGGRTAILKMVPSTTIQGMKFPGSKYGLKMVCGENPTRVYGAQNRAPMGRSGLMAMMRKYFADAAKYVEDWNSYADKLADENAETDPAKPDRNFQLDSIAGGITGDIRINTHCYRAEDMTNVLITAKEYNVKVSSFHHATEAYKIMGTLKETDTCIAGWGPDWGGFKMEAYDYSSLGIPMLSAAGVCVAVTSDSDKTGQHLNIDAARSLAAGQRAGLDVTEEDAIRWITYYPAKILGLEKETGTLETGKMADVVIWSANPFSSYAHPEKVFIDGVEVFDHSDPSGSPLSDYEITPSNKGDIQ